MTGPEARDLAARLATSWPGHAGISAETWDEELRDLDAGTAGTTLVRLRRELERPPSIARFHATYRALHTAHTDPLPTDRCTLCDGTGWVDAPDLTVGEEPHTRTYTMTQPCSACPAGDRARNVHRTIARTNGWHSTAEHGTPTGRQPEQLEAF